MPNTYHGKNFILLFFFNLFFLTLQNCISFAKYQNESTTGAPGRDGGIGGTLTKLTGVVRKTFVAIIL